MDTRVRRSQRDYSLAFKLAVVEQVEKGELTYTEAQQRYGIQGKSTVLKWLRKHGRPRQGPWSALSGPGAAVNRQSKTSLTPEQRIKELEVQLKQANEKAQLFEAVVDVLNNEYGVRIVKKPSGRSSRKSSSKR